MKSKKVILDTNLWISFLISNRLNQIDDLILDGKIKLIFSNLEEYIHISTKKIVKVYSGNLTTTTRLQSLYVA